MIVISVNSISPVWKITHTDIKLENSLFKSALSQEQINNTFEKYI